MHFPITEGIVKRKLVGEVKAVDGIDFSVRSRRDAWPGRRKRLRQDHDRPLHPAAGAADRRRDPVRRRRRRADGAQGTAGAAPAHPGDLPGPVQLAQSAHEGGRHHRRTDQGARHRAGCDEARRAGARIAVGLRAEPALRRPLPARDVGRAAAARRHRARAGAEPRVHRLRRGGLGAGRVDPGAGGEPAGGPARAVRPDLSVHCA